MPIEVLFDVITGDDCNKIINYYNSNKSQNNQPLEKLDRCEGGFMIKKEDSSSFLDDNDKIKQLRWSRKRLLQFKNYSSFSEEEEQLLYNSLLETFGSSKVKFTTKI